MKLALTAIVLTDAGVVAWAWFHTRGADFAMILFALACVNFFGSVPVLLAARTRRARNRADRAGREAQVIPRPGPGRADTLSGL